MNYIGVIAIILCGLGRLIFGKVSIRKSDLIIAAFLTFFFFLKEKFTQGSFQDVQNEEVIRALTYLCLLVSARGAKARDLFYLGSLVFITLVFYALLQILRGDGMRFAGGYGETYYETILISGAVSYSNSFSLLLLISSLLTLINLKKSRGKYIIASIILSTSILLLLAGCRSVIFVWAIALIAIFKPDYLSVRFVLVVCLGFIVAALSLHLYLERVDNVAVLQKGISSFFWRLGAWSVIIKDFSSTNFLIGEFELSVLNRMELNSVYATVEPHNDYIRAVYYFGIIGLLPYYYLIKKLYRGKILGKNWIIIASYVFLSSFENLYRDSSVMVITMIVAGAPTNRDERRSRKLSKRDFGKASQH